MNTELQPREMATAPRDGTMLRLLVRFQEHALEDTTEPCWTIGHNGFDHNGEDEWHFSGWCWCHDHFTAGKGTPIGWLPFHADAPMQGEPVGEALVSVTREDANNYCRILTALGMEEEGDPVAEVERLADLAAAPTAAQRIAPDWLQQETLAVLENVDTQFRATGQVSNRVETLINCWRGLAPAARIAHVELMEAQLAALRRALAEYPKRNPHQLQAAKVCAGVITLKDALFAETERGPSKTS